MAENTASSFGECSNREGSSPSARYFSGVLLGNLLAGVLIVGAFLWSLGIPLTRTDRNIASWYSVKEGICNKIGTQRKILLVGGSNVLYGISASQMQASLHLPVVNFGTHASLNLDYHLWRAEKVLHKGDSVLLSLEWSHFTRGLYEANRVCGPYLLAADPKYLKRLPPKESLKLVATADWDRLSLPFCLSKSESNQIQKKSNRSMARNWLNSNGDYIKNRQIDQRKVELKAIDDVIISPVLIAKAQTDITNPIWKRLGSFIQDCQNKGIVVWISAPSMMDAPAYRTPQSQAAYRQVEHNFETLGAQILTRQEETLYPRSWFFDTFYHLTSDARNERTKLILTRFTEQGVTFNPKS